MVLAGDASFELGRRAQLLAETAGIPLLAEPTSNARRGANAIPGYRDLLDRPLGRQIERVVLFGHPTLSRPVTRLLGRHSVEIIAVSDRAVWPDPGFAVDVVCDDVVLAPDRDPAAEQWLQAWVSASEIEPVTHSPFDPITGPELAAAVVASAEGNLVFGASSPIRDADLAPIRAPGPSIETEPVYWANRGLSGIDGVVSTGIGIALGTRRTTTVLVGDLGFLHDIGGLHIPASEAVPNLRIVVADDDGGAIFRGLGIAREAPELLERFFVMPHGHDLVVTASGFGWPARRVTTPEELAAALAVPIWGIEVIVVSIDPRR